MKKIYFLEHDRGVNDGEIFVFNLEDETTKNKKKVEKKTLENLFIFKETPAINNDEKLRVHVFDNMVLPLELYEELKLEWKKETENLYTSIHICMSEDKSSLEKYNDELRIDYRNYTEENYYRGRR